jgi:hypothetical protein
MAKRLNLCIYCGNLADGKDHLTARSNRAGARRTKHGRSFNYGFSNEDNSYIETVPACRECNSILGNISITDLRDRAKYVYKRLNERGASQERLQWCYSMALLD